MDYKFIFSWVALLTFCFWAWAALIDYVLMPTLHVLGGVFRWAVFR